VVHVDRSLKVELLGVQTQKQSLDN